MTELSILLSVYFDGGITAAERVYVNICFGLKGFFVFW